MENMEKLVVPDFSAQKSEEKPKKGDNLRKYREKQQLSKVNRNVPCIYCGTERILNPQQYQAYFDYWGDEDKVKRNFVCQPCDTEANKNPFLFWLNHHDSAKRLVRGLKAIFEVYKASPKAESDVLSLQNMTVGLLGENKIDAPNMEFITENKLPTGIRVKNMPFVGTIELKPYNEQKIHIL